MKTILHIFMLVAGLAISSPRLHAGHDQTVAGMDHQLIGRDGLEVSAEVITNKPYLFIYFSAGWCPLCQKFTPQLAEFYEKNYRNGDFEVLFVSSDKSPEEMRSYWAHANIPGVALK